MPKTIRKAPDNHQQAPLEDIRLLGRLPGDVIREQEGESACALMDSMSNSISKSSVSLLLRA